MLKYATLFILLAVTACGSHHELTECSGPFQSLLPTSTPAGKDLSAAFPPAPTKLGQER